MIPRVRVCGNGLVGVNDVLASYNRSGDFWETGTSVIHTMYVTNSTDGKDKAALVVTENVELFSLFQLFNSNGEAPRPPNNYAKGSVEKTHVMEKIETFRVEAPFITSQWV